MCRAAVVGILLASLCPVVACGAVRLGAEDTAFTVNGRRTFLVGMSYYGGLAASREAVERDFDDLGRRGFNWVRLWVTWAAHGNNVSAVDAAGGPREPFLAHLKWLIEQADRRDLVVDVTFSRGNGAVAAEPLLADHAAHLQAVETIAQALKPFRNVYIDVSNERNIQDRRHSSFAEVGQLRDRIKAVDGDRLVTASHAGELTRQDVEQYVLNCRLDFLSPHRPRNAKSPWQTADKTRECLTWMRGMKRVIPVHHQEPFRRDFSPWQPRALDFLVDAWQARQGGAAGWCLHNGSPKAGQDGPRRSFDLRDDHGRLFDQLDAEERIVADRVGPLVQATTKTWLALHDGRWYLNGAVTFPGAAAEGLLMNVRMVNATFEDRNDATRPAGFDADRNTDAFIARIPDYVAHGVRAFTLCLQGGMPGYEKALNSAFEADGSLRPAYLARVRRVIEAADAAGAAVILGCYYQRQDQVLRDEAAVRAGVANAARWVRECGFAHVAVEIANEYPHGGFDHRALKTPQGIAQLIRHAREAAPGLLVSASGLGNGQCHQEVCQAADFILIHFNGTPVERIAERVQSLKSYGKAVVCNEDDKSGDAGARAAEAAVRSGCSWGLMLNTLNQYVPFEFKGAADDAVIYAKLKQLTTAGATPP